MQPGRFLLRTALTALHRLRRAYWAAAGRRGRGVLAVPLTPEGKLVLVRLTYARGWYLPGGGVGRGEDPRDAALRELGEEIGMMAYGSVEAVEAEDGAPLFLVRDVSYAASSTWEIEEVAEFALDALPRGVTRTARAGIEAALPLIRSA